VWRVIAVLALAVAAAALATAVVALREARNAEPPTFGEISASAIRQLQDEMRDADGMRPEDVRRVLGTPTEVFRDNPSALCWRYESPYEIRMCWGPKRRRAWIAHNIPRELMRLDGLRDVRGG
jgi:hypothetical protein